MSIWQTGVLVTVAAVDGSGPREPGAHMLVRGDAVIDTVGGGHLELRAIEIARAMLADGRQRHFERFALGPSLGQCCGGVVYLAFEQLDEAHCDAMRARVGQDTWRYIALDGEPTTHVIPANAETHGRILSPLRSMPRGPRVRGDDGTHVVEEDGRRWLADFVRAPRDHLFLFGAGHVGTAIVRALADLPCTITWVDEREDQFPASVPANVIVEATDLPEAIVAKAPGGASYLVLTHSHTLDQRLAEAILSRQDVGWFGLIGSKTKRVQFERRLLARGIEQSRIDAMACPIGLPGIASKLPAAIAASVCAQLLMVWEANSCQTWGPACAGVTELEESI